MSATALWTAVKASYATADLIQLTNIRENTGSIDDTYGQDASQDVINLWPIYTQEVYDASDDLHVSVAKQVVIALLWRRGGTSTGSEQIKWEEAEALLQNVKRTGPRARKGPKSNSGVQQKTEFVNGRPIRGWSDRESYPGGFLPSRRRAED